MKKILLIFFLIIVNCIYSFSQKNSTYGTWQVFPHLHYGFILKHRELISPLTHQHLYGLELDFERKYNYQYINDRQKFGISTVFFNFRNPLIGTEIGIYPYYKTYFHKKHIESKQMKFGMRIGAGLGYFTNRFNRQDNPQNFFISSSISGVLHFKLFYETKNFNTGLSFTHTSNGAFKLPNSGINVITVSVGKSFSISKLKYYKKWNNDTLCIKGKAGFIFEVSNALREVFPTGGKKYWVSGFSVLGYKNVGNAIALTTGLDYFYNRALLEEQRKDNLGTDAPDITQIGLNIGTEIYFGQFSSTIQIGYVIYDKYNFFGKVYTKMGMKYHIYKNIWSGLRLKANGSKADFIEWTIHYKIASIPNFKKKRMDEK